MKPEKGDIAMTHKGRKRRKRSTSTHVNHLCADVGFPLVKQLIRYAINLLTHSTYTEKFLEYAIAVLSEDGIKNLIEYIKDNLKPDEEIFNSYERLSDPNVVADKTIILLTHDKLKVTKEELYQYVFQLISTVEKESPESSTSLLTPELQSFKNIFQLNEEEVQIIVFCFCQDQSDALEDLLREDNVTYRLKIASSATGIPYPNLRKALHSENKLLQYGLLLREERGFYWNYQLDESLKSYLVGVADESFSEKYCKRYQGPSFVIDSFGVADTSIDILSSLIRAAKGCSILFYGEPGTGKTEFSKALASHCQKELYFVNHEKDEQLSGKKLAIQVADRTIDPSKGIVVIDEADSLLSSEIGFFTHNKSFEKSWLNSFLDKSKSTTIWIANNIEEVNASILRRFNHNIHFKQYSRKQRERVWVQLVKKYQFSEHLPENLVRTLAATYKTNAAGIDSALSTLKILDAGNRDSNTLKRYLEELLGKYCRLTKKQTIHGQSNFTHQWYDPAALNVDIDIMHFIDSLMRYKTSKSGSQLTRGGNFTALFWGIPGTGKTEFARYLAYQIGCEITQKRSSDLLSPWVGQTERNIRRTFEEAEESDSILLIDEADSLFHDREAAHHSWEISQTNELINQMNSFKGILFCCTNMLAIIDHASIRRFDWKIEFKPLTEEGRVLVFQKYFKKIEESLAPESIVRLIELKDVTFGDIYAVWKRLRFTNGKNVSHERIIELIEKEAAYRYQNREKQIGFL
jgi:SpoVK/Ycf46/Vps4 family AAA+-type ATPase